MTSSRWLKSEVGFLAERIVGDIAEEMGAAIVDLGIKAPETKNDLTAPYPFNLMFPTQIGPSGAAPGFLRPETAQGIFVNFRDLLYYNGALATLANIVDIRTYAAARRTAVAA